MKTYIGTKIIQAEPAFRIDGEIYPESGPVPRSMNREEGYRVHYPDGYESWSPKGVFEQAYLPVTVNPDLRTDSPSISQQMVDDFILKTWTQTMGDKTTVVRAMLRNGFEIMESSACVSAENYDEKLGREICLGKIKDKVWFLLGFLLAAYLNVPVLGIALLGVIIVALMLVNDQNKPNNTAVVDGGADDDF
mgnify:CR=1 FL=1